MIVESVNILNTFDFAKTQNKMIKITQTKLYKTAYKEYHRINSKRFTMNR